MYVSVCTPNLPTNVTPANTTRVKLSGKFPMGLGIPPLVINIMLESNPLKFIMLVRGLAVSVYVYVSCLQLSFMYVSVYMHRCIYALCYVCLYP